MTEPTPLSADDAENLAKLFDHNASHAPQRFTDMAATWGLGGIHNQLDELLHGLRPADRPKTAVNLADALGAYVDEFGPGGIVGQSDTFRDHA
jgi:hypothetical protein